MNKISISQGKFTLVDDDDYDWLKGWNWHFSQGYADRSVWSKHLNRKFRIGMHRQIMNILHDPAIQVDHINGDSLDNRKSNMRLCTPQQNSWNKRNQKNSLSKYRGVRILRSGNWEAGITVSGKNIILGTRLKEEDAGLIYDEAAKKYFGEFARLNFPEEAMHYHQYKEKEQ